MPSLLLLQWGFIGLYVIINFFKGFMRGTAKATYYLVVALITTAVVILLISQFSLNLFLSPGFTFEALVNLIQGWTGNALPSDIVIYLTDPELVPLVIAVIDMVLRLVLFFALFPILKGLLTLIVFVPIWKFFIKKPLLARQNQKAYDEFQMKSHKNRRFVPSKRLKKTFISRLFGGFAGAVHGFILAFIILLPVLVFTGFISGFSDAIQTSATHPNETQLSTSLNSNLPFDLPQEVYDYLAQVKEMDEQGLGMITRTVLVGDVPIDRYIFDLVFTTQVKAENVDPVDINWIGEVEGLLGIAQVVIQGGYLDPDFSYEQVSEDNLEDLEKIFGHIGNSSLLGYMIPFATKYGVNNLLPEYLDGVNLYDRPYSKDALDEFTTIDWKDEFNNIYGILEAALQFASVGEWMDYLGNPESLLELSEADGQRFANIVRAFGNLEMLTLAVVAADYATTLTDIQAQITWIAENEREAYLQERLDFLLENPRFFIGENGEFASFAALFAALYTDDFENVSLRHLMDNLNDPETYLNEDYAAYFGMLLEKIVDIELLIELIPLGVDFGLYNALGDTVDAALADQIIETLEPVSWDAEILNIGDVYKEIAKLGLAALFGESPDYFEIIDSIAVNHMASLRTIVAKVFEESEVVNSGLKIAAPYAVENFVDDPVLKDLLLEALGDDENGAITFSFGQELNNILTVAETIYMFTTSKELLELSSMNQEAMLQLASSFGALSLSNYARFETAIQDLQILNRLNTSALSYAKDRFGIEQLYVPSTVNLEKDITAVLGLAYHTARFIHTESSKYNFYEEIDFAPLFNDEVFRSYLIQTELNNHSNLLIQTLAHNAMLYADDPTISQYLSVPFPLNNATPEDEAWMTEINHLLSSVLDIAGSFENVPNFKLSLQQVMQIANDPTSANLSLITRFKDETVANNAFGSLDESLILRSSLFTAINTFGATLEGTLNGHAVRVPEIANDNQILKVGMITDLVSGIATLVDGMNQTLGYQTIADAINTEYMFVYVNAFNQLDDAVLERFSDITLLRGVIGDALTSPELQSYARDLVANTGLVTPSENFLKFERPNRELPASELAELFIAFKSLQVTEDLYNNPMEGLYAYLQTFDDEKLDAFFDAKILREIFTFVLADPGIIDSVAGIVEASYANIQSTQPRLAEVNPNFPSIVGSLGTYRRLDGLFETNEIKSMIRAFNELNITSTAELSSLANLTVIHNKVANSEVVEELFGSNWLYDNVNYVFTNEDLQDQIADLASGQALSQAGVNKIFTRSDVSFALPNYGLIETDGNRKGGIKVSEIKKFILSGTRLDWPTVEFGAGQQIVANLSSILLEVGNDGERHIDVIMDSNILVAIFDKVLNFEYGIPGVDEVIIGFVNTRLAGNPTFGGIELEPSILHYDVRAYDGNLVLRREEIIEMVEAAAAVDLSMTIGVPTFYNMIQDGTFDEIFDSYIIHSLISNVLTNEVVQQFGIDFANNLQQIVELDDDFLSVDPVLMDGDLFKQSEIENIIIALYTLGLVDNASFSSIGLPTFTNLSGQNYDPVTDEDDFDRVFNAHYIYIILDRVLKLESLGIYVGDMLGDALGVNVTDLDLTPHPAMLGDGSATPVEQGRVTKDEFRRITVSLGVLGDISGVGLQTFTNMINPYDANDDFSIFIASDYIYIILARLFENEGFGDYVGELLAGVFGEDQEAPSMTPPSDAKGTTVGALDEGVMTRVELRNLFVSFRLLGEDPTAIGIGSVMGLIGANVDPDTDEDDMDLFLTSLYIQDKLSFILLSDSIIEMLANGLFDPADFELPHKATVSIDGNDRLTKDEMYKIFLGLKTLGIEDEESLGEISQDTIFGLSDQELDTVIDSDYLYTVIDLVLKGQDVFEIPAAALEAADDPDYPNKIKKSEIKDVFKAVELLGASNPDEFVAEDITIAQIKDVLAQTSSAIVQKLLSDAIIDAIGADKIPDDAYESEGMLSLAEIEALVAALEVLAGDDDVKIIDVDFENVTVGQANDIDLTETGSKIVKQLISDEILNAISVSDIPEDAYHPLLGGGSHVTLLGMLDAPSTPLRRLSDLELQEIILALNIMANDPNNTDPDFDPMLVKLTDISTAVTVGQAIQLKTNNSLIIRQLISDNVIEVLGEDMDIPQESYDPDYPMMLSKDEISALLDAMLILANGEENTLVEDIQTDVTVGQAKQFKGNASHIIKQLLSDAIIDAIGVDDIPLEAYIDEDPSNRLTDEEIDAMIDAIGILGEDHELVSAISTQVTVGQAVEFKDTPSLIIQQLLSDAIIDAIDPNDEGKIPLDAYIDGDSNNRLTIDEINHMIDALVILANNDLNTLVEDISTDLTVGQLKALDEIPSIIMKQQMSDQIIEAVGVDNVPLDAYVDGDSTNRLTDTEITQMIAALAILAQTNVDNDPEIDHVDNVLVADVSTDVTVGQTKELNAENTSLIIKQIISDAIIDMIGVDNIPLGAYMDSDPNNRLTDEEISDMIDALDILTNGNDDLLVTDIDTDITLGQLKALNGLPSLITTKLISDSIIDAVGVDSIPLEAYIDGNPNNNLTQAEVDEMIAALEIFAETNVANDPEIDDVDDVLVSDVSTDVTVGQTKRLNAENSSIIIKQIISDAIIDMIGVDGIPLGAYIDGDSENRLTDDEISEMIAALDILANGDDDLLVTLVSTDITIGQLKDLESLPSLITQKLISDSIIDAVGVDSVPLDAYIDGDSNNNLTAAEVSNMILALEILAGSVVPGDKDDEKISDIVVDVTVGQAQDLKSNDSFIIKQIISDAIVDMMNTADIIIPLSAYIDQDDTLRLTNDEIGYMIDALTELSGGNTNQKVANIEFDETALTVATLKEFNPASIVLNRVISTALIQNITNMPVESYVVVVDPLDPDYQKDILRVEIDNLLEALDRLGIGTDGASNIGASDVTFADLDYILSLGTPGSDYEHPTLAFSPLIAHIMSTPMIEAVSDVRSGHNYGVPSTAYRNDHDLLHDELTKLVLALKVIGDVGTDPGQNDPEDTSIADAVLGLDPSSFDYVILGQLLNVESLIVYRMISIGINDSNIANPDAYALVGDVNYDDQLPLSPEIYDIKIAEMIHMTRAMEILDLDDISDLSGLTLGQLQALSPEHREELVEADTDGPNTIIYYLVAETIDSALIPLQRDALEANGDYVMDGPTRVRLKRTAIADALALI